MEITDLIDKYNSQDKCIAYLEDKRWGETPICPYCSSSKSSSRKSYRYLCRSCNSSYSVLVGTMFQATKLPLTKWFLATILILNAKKGISSLQLARDLNVNRKTGWYIQKRIREAMGNDDIGILNGIIEADETYVGGKMRNKSLIDRKSKYSKVVTGMEYHKVPALGMLERNGKIKIVVLEKANGETIKPLLAQNISLDSEIVTDGFGGYSQLDKVYKKHVIINKSSAKHRKGDYHMNTIEGFWSLFKRSLVGQYHKVSKKFLQSYMNELAFKYNNRNKNSFDQLIECTFL